MGTGKSLTDGSTNCPTSTKVNELIQKIDELVDSIYSLIAALAVEPRERYSEDDEEEAALFYLDGTRRNL